jgi:twitching motility protein PilT
MAFDLYALLRFAHDEGASDVHLSAGLPPMVRIRGEIARLEMPALRSDEVLAAVHGLVPDDLKRRFEETHDLDFAFEVPGLSRFRANVLMQGRGVAAVFRLVPTKVFTLEQLGMPPVLRQLAEKEKGLVVVTGPTGSGKSTTLAAMVDYVNSTMNAHILTVEDPVEFVHQPKRSLVNQREVGPHTQSFAAALRAALREDPDVILVGELRDLETTQLAISAAETGHLVFATLHTNSAAKTIDRIIDIFPSAQQAQIRTMLSESLEGVIAQTLLPAKDGKGRVAALEVMVGVPALRNLIRENKTAQILSVIQTGANHGMISLDQHLRELVMQGRLSRQDAAAHASNPSVFETPAAAPAAPTATGAPAARPAHAPDATAVRPAPATGVPVTAPRPAPGIAMGPPGPPKKPGLFGR